ncbi:MAG: zf-TFIIB domain-containing protein [Pseudomonadota bacterium]
MKCPKCGSERLEALDTAEGVQLDFCADCGGVLFDAREVAEYFELDRDIPDLKAVKDAARWSGIECPKCGGPWAELPYAPGEDLLIDLCTRCGVIWLDRGELPKLEALAAGIDKPSSKILRAVKTVERQGYQVLGFRR